MYYVRFSWSRSGLDPYSLDSESSPSRISACKAGHTFQHTERVMFYALSLPSADPLTATNLSKLSSTRTRIASERESMEACKCAIPAAKSWYVAFG